MSHRSRSHCIRKLRWDPLSLLPCNIDLGAENYLLHAYPFDNLNPTIWGRSLVLIASVKYAKKLPFNIPFHSITLGNQSLWHHLDVLLIPQAYRFLIVLNPFQSIVISSQFYCTHFWGEGGNYCRWIPLIHSTEKIEPYRFVSMSF